MVPFFGWHSFIFGGVHKWHHFPTKNPRESSNLQCHLWHLLGRLGEFLVNLLLPNHSKPCCKLHIWWKNLPVLVSGSQAFLDAKKTMNQSFPCLNFRHLGEKKTKKEQPSICQTSAVQPFVSNPRCPSTMGRLQGVTILQSAALAFFVTTALTVGIGFGLGTAAPLANHGERFTGPTGGLGPGSGPWRLEKDWRLNP